jgi:hypothetical protein
MSKLTRPVADSSIKRRPDNPNIKPLLWMRQAFDMWQMGKRRDARETPLCSMSASMSCPLEYICLSIHGSPPIPGLPYVEHVPRLAAS